MPIEVSPTPLVGRTEELRALAELVGAGTVASGAVRAGTVAAGAVLLGGDAGAGKTRLVAELIGEVSATGWQVLIGHCLDFGDSSLPYLPFSEALGRLAAESPERAADLVEHNPALGPLLPAHRMIRDRSDAGAEPTGRAALFDAVHAGLNQLGAEAPSLLIIEDVHWADQSTRDLIRLLLARRFESPVAILATYRSDDLHRRHPLRADLAEWSRLPAVSRMQLGPLSDADSRALVRSLTDAPIGEDELRQILDRAEGNPFFIEELVDARLASGGSLPVDLADLLLVRLEQLDDDGRLAVRAAAVAGRRVSHVLLAHGTDLAEARLEDAMRAAVEANILTPLGRDGYAFRHALLAEAIYLDLLPGERVRLHARYAAALANGEVEGAAAELARHARASHDLDTATRASVQAGDEAMSVGGPEEALRHYELALELLTDARISSGAAGSDGDRPDHLDRTELVLRASAAAAAAGHLVRSVALAESQLRALPEDAPALDRVRLIHAIALTAQVMDHQLDILALTTEANQLMADLPPSRLRANVLLVHARSNADRAHDDDAARWASEALAIARDLDLAAVVTDAKLLLAKLDARAGDPQAAEAAITAAITTARDAGESLAEVRGIYNLASLHYAQGRVPQAIELFAEAAKRACAIGRQWAPYGLDAVGFGAIASVVNGDWARAEEMVDLTGVKAPEFARALFRSVAMEIAAGRGDLSALDLLPGVRESWEIDGMVPITSGPAAIELYGYAGDLMAAQAIHDDTVATVNKLWQHMDFGGRIRLAALLLGQFARAATTAGEGERADLVRRGDQLAAKAERVADAVRHLGPEGRAWVARARAETARLHWLAGIDPPEETALVADWRAAVEGFEEFGHVYETARSRARLAAVLIAAGDTGEAGKQAELAREAANRLGARPLLEELRATVGNGPAPERGSTSRLGERLTAREQEVLVLVATGRSNREIGQQLFISAKTVSVHVSNLMAKLDAGSRTEAVAIARRNHLLG